MHRRDLLKYSTFVLGGALGSSVTRALASAAPISQGLLVTAFNESQQTSVALLSEMIIPTTDTPGAIQAGVPDFIASIVSEWYNLSERKAFFQGLSDLDQYCQAIDGKTFAETSDAAQLQALRKQEQLANEFHAGSGGDSQNDEDRPFFDMLKELVVVGYYASEVGAKQEWRYLPMPGYYDGEYDLSKVGRQWTS